MSVSADTIIDTQRALEALVELLSRSDWVSIDTEADSLRSYPDKLCLIQISITAGDFLVDPLAGIEMGGFVDVLRGRELYLHGADYDLRLLRRTYGFVPTSVFDTMIAARLLGHMEFGLAALVFQYFGVQLSKSAQKSDWRQRPLSRQMMDYARKDSHYLFSLVNILKGDLASKGRTEWLSESCQKAIHDAAKDSPQDKDQCWRIKGSSGFAPRELAVLRELWHWRESEALIHCKPPYFVFPHEALVRMAKNVVECGIDNLKLPAQLKDRRRSSFLAAMEIGLNLPDSECPSVRQFNGRRLTFEEGEEMERLKKRRDLIASELGIDPTLIATRSDLAGYAMDWDMQVKLMLPWQVKLMEHAGAS